MEFKGLLPLSLIEYPRKVVAVIYTGGCNFRCPWCYNRDLVLNPSSLPSIPERNVLNFLSTRKKWLDGIAITGGEPTIHAELPRFIKKVKKLGFSVALETNGSNPEMLESLIEKKLVDYVALDIKAPLKWEKYKHATNIKNRTTFKKILKSIELLKGGKVDYEFRTTFVPKLMTEDTIVTIAKQLKGAKRYAVQQYIPRTTVDKRFERLKPFKREALEKLGKKIKNMFQNFELRNV